MSKAQRSLADFRTDGSRTSNSTLQECTLDILAVFSKADTLGVRSCNPHSVSRRVSIRTSIPQKGVALLVKTTKSVQYSLRHLPQTHR